MKDATRFYIDGAWTTPTRDIRQDIIDPSTGQPVGQITLGGAEDVDKAVAAAKRAFASFSRSTVSERLALLEAINAQLIARNEDIAQAISCAMGAPLSLARHAQAPSGTQHFSEVIRVLRDYPFEQPMGTTMVRREPVGLCALITPWNWPMNQIATKVAPAIAAGCTMVLKPSELAPLDAVILAEIMHEVGVPAGVFNLIHGTGEGVGNALTSHPDVDMVSFTGSTQAGIAIGRNAAPTIKRVALELGGKSANIVLDDADLARAIPHSVRAVMLNSGQSCNAPTRLLVPEALYDEVVRHVAATAREVSVGPAVQDAQMGPIANKTQYRRVVALIESGVAEGAELIVGGPDRPIGLADGFFVAPTVFGRVTPDMTIARNEVFGPVLAIMTYRTLEEAIEIANDSEYGLSGYVWGTDRARAYDVASRLRTGMVHLNGAPLDTAAPFGGYKMSGNGREWGVFGLEEFLETKSVFAGAAA